MYAAHIAPPDAEGAKELERAGESRAGDVSTEVKGMREREVTIVSMDHGVKIIYAYGDPTPTPPFDASSVARRPRGGGPPRRQSTRNMYVVPYHVGCCNSVQYTDCRAFVCVHAITKTSTHHLII